MKTPSRGFRVFVSSTSEDLRDYRAVARNEILNMDWHPEMMEYFGASPKPTLEACHEKLKSCDLMVLIVAFRRGWVPIKEQDGNGSDSITALELAYARKHNIPVLALLANETWPGNLWENESDARVWVKKFREELNLPAVFFDYEQPSVRDAERFPKFRAKVSSILVDYQKQLLTEQREVAEDEIDYFTSARDSVIGGNSIPFVGAGVFGDGPLGMKALILSLRKEDKEEPLCLATAAEYQERYLGQRMRLLQRLQQTIKEQSCQVDVPEIYELLCQVKTPPIIVCANYDLVLENRLEEVLSQEGKSIAIVTHIIHSFEGENDGKILIFRRGEEPEICLADQFDRRNTDLVIYKPLGSPLLNDQLNKLNPDLEIDTVVITETDHLTFLGRLENQHTKIPTAFSRLFQRNSLLFIGYTLGVWHYRLVMQVFQSVGARGRSVPIMAVINPEAGLSEMEKLTWKRLGADLIHMSPNEFAARVFSDLGKEK